MDFCSVPEHSRKSNTGFYPSAELEFFAVVKNEFVNVGIVARAKVAGYPVLVTKVGSDGDLIVMQVVVRLDNELELLSGGTDGGDVDFVDFSAFFQGLEKDDAHGAKLEFGLFGVTEDRKGGETLEMFRGVFCRGYRIGFPGGEQGRYHDKRGCEELYQIHCYEIYNLALF